MRGITAALVLMLASGTAHADDEEILGVVLAVGDVDEGGALRAARDAGGASWRSAHVEAAAPEAAEPPSAVVEELRGFYLEADFLRCLSLLSDRRLDRDALVAAGHLEAAAAVHVFGGACALGADDADLAESLFDELATFELPASDALQVVSPDVQQLAEARRDAVARQDRITLNVASRPRGAALSVDGVQRCAATPCEVSLAPGEHILVIEALGYVPRTESRLIRSNTTVELALDPASSGVARQQLAAALHRDVSPDDALFIRAASRALGARLVLSLFTHGNRLHAALYDRQSDRVVAESAVSGDDDVGIGVRSVVSEWRGETEPTPIYRSPWFWLATIGAAAIAGVIVGLLVIPPEPRHDVVFGN